MSALAALTLFLLTAPRALAETDPVYVALRAARPSGAAVAVRDLTLQRDVFRFRFEDGRFQFLAPVEGRVTGAVFVGRGSWELRPSTEGERRHLAHVADEKGLEVLADRFEKLVLLFTDGTEEEIRRGGSEAPAGAERAGDVWDSFRKRERKDLKTNLQVRVLGDLLRAPDPGNGVFLAFVDGKDLPPAVACVDPRGLEWISPWLLMGGEESVLFVVHETEGGLWYLARSKASTGSRGAVGGAAVAEHYAIDTTVLKNTDLKGTTTIRFRPRADGLRVLPISLEDGLRLQDASFAGGEETTSWTPAAVIQEKKDEDSDAAVVFPHPLAKGEVARLRLTYEGEDVLTSAGDGNYFVGARESWYPNLGVFREGATYDLTYRVPKKNEVVSVGDLVESRIEENTRVSVWKASRPIRVAGFNYGTFQTLEQSDPDSGLRVRVFTNPGTPDIIREIDLSGVRPERLADSAMADGINTARVGSIYFGALPFGHVAITQQSQWFFGQSWPSLIFLPYLSFLDSYNRFRLGLQGISAFVDAVGPHEFAHQWWGHLVGWDSYRDQWLSEGFSEFTAVLVLEYTAGLGKASSVWETTRKWILEKPRGSSVANTEAGPIIQGYRLAHRRSPAAAEAMMYSKGAFVLHMLRMMMRDSKSQPPDASFIAMMHDYVTTWSGKNPSTRDFQAVVERHMTPNLDQAKDGKMDWFFDQWVYGTEIPRYKVKLEVKPTSTTGEYRITGSISQEEVSPTFRAVVPLYVEFDKGEMHRLGTMPMAGTATLPLSIWVTPPNTRWRAFINGRHDVLYRD